MVVYGHGDKISHVSNHERNPRVQNHRTTIITNLMMLPAHHLFSRMSLTFINSVTIIDDVQIISYIPSSIFIVCFSGFGF